MRVMAISTPSNLPTVVCDPGLWWDTVAENGRYELDCFSANHAWWRTIFGPQIKSFILAGGGRLARLNQRAIWWSRNVDLEANALAAGRALDELTTRRPYQSVAAYCETLSHLARFLRDFHRTQSELLVDVEHGPIVLDLDYNSSRALVAYSQRDSILSRSITAALEQCPCGLDFVALSATSPYDLLTCLITARHVRELNPGVHISLVDHGYENYSLHSHVPALRKVRTLDTVFDTIIAQKDDRDTLVPALIAAVEEGRPVQGYLTRFDLPIVAAPPTQFSPPPPLPTFAPERVFLTRLSKRRCYWSKCTYCTQNSKYSDVKAPSHAEIRSSLDRLEKLVAAGYSHFLFADEAVSPSTLRLLADEIDRRQVHFHWACRCKLEHAHTADLFERVAKAGCYEILYGLESTSPRVLKLMGKYTEGLDETCIAQVFREMTAVGITAYIALIGGFPGDTLADTGGTVDFIAKQATDLPGATFFLNRFALFPDTPIARTPQQFGVARLALAGDIAMAFDYELVPEIRDTTAEVMQALPNLDRRLDDAFGWTPLLERTEGRMAKILYFQTGHSAVFRTQKYNPFAHLTERFASQVAAANEKSLTDEKTANLPVRLPTKFDLVINLDTR